MPTTIAIQDVSKNFPSPSGGVTTAVNHVSLTVHAGELFFLLGPSGCGKTTLLRMIAGFIDPTSGQILFGEPRTSSSEGQGKVHALPESDADVAWRDVTHLAPNKRNTGMVFQSYALWPHMSVYDNVAFGLSVRRTSADQTKTRVMEALAAVQMQDYAARKPNQLSGGQQQRIALARALVIRPSVLLLDEPLSNLDAKLRNELRSEIRKVCKASGTTAIYVTHDQKEALSMADRVAIMNAGQVAQIGTPSEMYRRPASRFVAEFLGETNLLEGKVISASESVIRVETPAGALVSRSHAPRESNIDEEAGEDDAPPPGKPGAAKPAPKQAPRGKPIPGAFIPSQGSRVLVSLRPESIRLSPGWAPAASENVVAARVVETTFLGDTAQHIVEIKNGPRLKLAQLNPLAHPPRPGEARIEVSPEDVVVLPPV